MEILRSAAAAKEEAKKKKKSNERVEKTSDGKEEGFVLKVKAKR